jgi:hypothetical protein
MCTRSVSRTTASRYANELSSSIDGTSCGNAWSSARRARWRTGLHASSKSAKAVVIEVVSCPISTRGEGQYGRWGSSGILHTRYYECWDLVEDLLEAELLLGGEVLVHVRLDEKTEQVFVLAFLEPRSPTGGLLLQDGLLLLADELETDAAHRLPGPGENLGLLVHPPL